MATESKTTIKPSGQGGDYTSLSGWEAGEQSDLVTDDVYAVGSIDGTWSAEDTGQVSIDGWTTDATRYIEVRTEASARHDGKWDTGAYIKSHTTTVLLVDEDFVRLIGLQILCTSTTTFRYGVSYNSTVGDGAEQHLSHSILKGSLSGSAASVYGISLTWIASGTRTLKCWNNVLYDWINSTNDIRAMWLRNGWSAFCFNNTVQNCYDGYYTDFEIGKVVNCIAQDCTNDGFIGTFASGSDYNCSDISSDAPGGNSQTGEVTFVNEGSDDFHLDSSDSVAKDNGTDLSSDLDLSFSDDIDGDTRSGSWDIGADESTAAAAGQPTMKRWSQVPHMPTTRPHLAIR